MPPIGYFWNNLLLYMTKKSKISLIILVQTEFFTSITSFTMDFKSLNELMTHPVYSAYSVSGSNVTVIVVVVNSSYDYTSELLCSCSSSNVTCCSSI